MRHHLTLMGPHLIFLLGLGLISLVILENLPGVDILPFTNWKALGGGGLVLALLAFLLTYSPLQRTWISLWHVPAEEVHAYHHSAAFRILDSLCLGLAYLGCWGAFLALKKTYGWSDSPRAFYDTYSYVAVAEKPLTSSAFWIADRSFTLPLFYKMLGVNTANYGDAGIMARVALVQRWFSVVAWSILASVVAMALRNRWVRLVGFGLILCFSLSLEVSLWDFLLLSESLSLSLLALTLAGWLGLLLLLESLQRPPHGATAGLTLVIAVLMGLYSFTRDTNLYFLLIGAAALAALTMLKRVTLHLRWPLIGLTLFILALFAFQNFTLIHGNRWQIHIYDNLKVRIIPNPSARAFFVNAGLPLTPRFLEIQSLSQRDYQKAMFTEPALQSVRDWVEQKGRATYLAYLLSRPLPTLIEPLQQAFHLLNGDNREYRRPLDALPQRLLLIDRILYPRQMTVLLIFIGLSLASLVGYWTGKNLRALGWVVSVLLVSLYPLMLITWHGNPLEIERHATQIGVQLRLMGWLTLLVWGDWVASQRRKWCPFVLKAHPPTHTPSSGAGVASNGHCMM